MTQAIRQTGGAPGQMRRVKIDDLARVLKMSKSTVSRALNGYPDIAEDTRQRVRTEAARMGYVPLSSAQAIRTGRAKALGLVLRVDNFESHRAFLTDFLDGICRAAAEQGWTLTVTTALSVEDELSAIRRLIAERKADGLILPRTRIGDPRIELLQSAGIPFVIFGRVPDMKDCSWFDILGEAAFSEAVAHCATLGHRRIAFVNGRSELTSTLQRFEGYKAGFAEAGLPLDPALIRSDAMTPDEGRRATEALLELDDPPTAILFAVDWSALGAYPAAQARGMEIGRDLTVIGYDGAPEGLQVAPKLSTFAVDTRHAGGRLARLLIEQIRGGDPATLRETARATFLRRGSDGPPPDIQRQT